MNPIRRCLRIALLATILLSAARGFAADLRSWVTEDSISVRYVDEDAIDATVGTPIVTSPDAAHFFFVTRQGNLAADSVHYRLWVFAERDVRRALLDKSNSSRPAPLRLVTMRSASSDSMFQRGIMNARWYDRSTVLFQGLNGEQYSGVYRLNILTGELARLSDPQHNVSHKWQYRSGSLVYLAMDGVYSDYRDPKRGDPLDAYPALPIVGDELRPQLTGYFGLIGKVRQTYYVSSMDASVRSLVSFTPEEGDTAGPWLSPDGRWAVLVFPASVSDVQRADSRDDKKSSPIMLIDLKNGQRRPIGTTAVVRDFEAFWSSDSHRVILLNAESSTGASDRGKHASAVVDYDVGTGHATAMGEIVPPKAPASTTQSWRAAGRWSRGESKFLVDYVAQAPSSLSNSLGCSVFARHPLAWKRHDLPDECAPEPVTAVAKPRAFSVRLRESANDPPMVLAAKGRRVLALMDVDPALVGIWRASMREVNWTDPDGETEAGGLMLPRQHANALPPLVIQPYHYQPEKFTPDGVFSTAYAAQALVARGFAVLFMNTPIHDRRALVGGTPEEGRYFVRRIDAAVDALASQGLIDSKRVALVGFSRGGWGTYYTITHPGQTEISAAVVADGWTGSYGEYVLYAGYESPSRIRAGEFESQNGGEFWKNREAWLANAPSFNLGRMRTPTLFTASNLPLNILASVETLGALRLSHRPYEFLAIPKGAHELHRPRERLASMTATVDWLSFWILKYEDPSAEKAGLYQRWRDVRDEWEARKSSEIGASAK